MVLRFIAGAARDELALPALVDEPDGAWVLPEVAALPEPAVELEPGWAGGLEPAEAVEIEPDAEETELELMPVDPLTEVAVLELIAPPDPPSRTPARGAPEARRGRGGGAAWLAPVFRRRSILLSVVVTRSVTFWYVPVVSSSAALPGRSPLAEISPERAVCPVRSGTRNVSDRGAGVERMPSGRVQSSGEFARSGVRVEGGAGDRSGRVMSLAMSGPPSGCV
jgi:hypothetical protein